MEKCENRGRGEQREGCGLERETMVGRIKAEVGRNGRGEGKSEAPEGTRSIGLGGMAEGQEVTKCPGSDLIPVLLETELKQRETK